MVFSLTPGVFRRIESVMLWHSPALAAFLLLCLTPSLCDAGAPRLKVPRLKKVNGVPQVVTKPGKFLSPGLNIFGPLPDRVFEYGVPALQIKSSGVDVRQFAWRGSMEGVRVDPLTFSGQSMRRKHRPIGARLSGLFCDDVGEDAISIAPRARVHISRSTVVGNYGRKRGSSSAPGQDKLVQIDGAQVTIEKCDFYHGARAIRAKANTTLIVRDCRFIRCKDCVTGSAEANPGPENPYDNGQPGACHITLINCEAWDCGSLARAHKGCTITLINCRVHDTTLTQGDGGTFFFRSKP